MPFPLGAKIDLNSKLFIDANSPAMAGAAALLKNSYLQQPAGPF